MPFTFLAHQAAVLPLKLARPSWFDGTALVVGSMAPDFEYFWQALPESGWAHSPAGIALFCVPATVAVATILRTTVARPLAAHLPDEPLFRLRDYGALEAGLPRTALAWARTVASAFVGAGTHVVWDGFTHAETFVTALFPWLATPLFHVAGLPIRPAGLLQILSSAGGILVALALLHAIARRRAILEWTRDAAPLPTPTAASTRALALPALAGALGGLAWGLLTLRAPTTYVFLSLLVRALFRCVLGGSVGLLAGCALARRRLEEAGEMPVAA